MRTCTTCGFTGELEANFYKHPKGKDGRLGQCRLCIHAAARRRYHAGYRDRHAAVNRAYRKRQRLEVFARYGGAICVCCGEDKYEFLQIDHINGGGNAHRKKYRTRKIEEILRIENYPDGFRVLCANCNFSRGHYGMCPHEAKVTAL